METISDTDLQVAMDYHQHRQSTVQGVNIPEAWEDFLRRTGQSVRCQNSDYLLDYALVKLYPKIFVAGYLERKYGN